MLYGRIFVTLHKIMVKGTATIHMRRTALHNITMAVLLFLFGGQGLGAYAQRPGTVDSAFVANSRPIIFVVNKTSVSADDRHWLADSLRTALRAIGPTGIIVGRATASPEGPLEGNKRLAEGRRRTVDGILRRLGYDTDRIHYDVVAEDYDLLCTLMSNNRDAASDVVDSLHFAHAHEGKSLKAALQAEDGGALWQRLLREYFPSLRAVRIMAVDGRLLVDGYLMPDLQQKDFPQIDIKDLAKTENVTDYDRDYKPLTEYPWYGVADEGARIPRRELLSVKTNLLFDFAYMPGYDRFCPIPNVAIEYYPLHGHFTYGASFDCPWWQHYHEYKFFQLRNYQVEARYYFKSGDVDKVGYGKGAAFRGLYVQAYGHAGLYSICFDEDRGWEGEGVGAGVGVGYVLPLSKKGHWRLEFGLQAGVFWTKYDPYQYESVIYPDKRDDLYYYKFNNFGNFFTRRQHRLTWLGPTRVGITLSYDLLYRKRMKKGASFRSWEAVR